MTATLDQCIENQCSSPPHYISCVYLKWVPVPGSCAVSWSPFTKSVSLYKFSLPESLVLEQLEWSVVGKLGTPDGIVCPGSCVLIMSGETEVRLEAELEGHPQQTQGLPEAMSCLSPVPSGLV